MKGAHEDTFEGALKDALSYGCSNVAKLFEK